MLRAIPVLLMATAAACTSAGSRAHSDEAAAEAVDAIRTQLRALAQGFEERDRQMLAGVFADSGGVSFAGSWVKGVVVADAARLLDTLTFGELPQGRLPQLRWVWDQVVIRILSPTTAVAAGPMVSDGATMTVTAVFTRTPKGWRLVHWHQADVGN